ncbi:MAG: ABC transporter substrate-binding protein [Peptococcaceae bacterium]|nr:ABC transporter substrate-binding protein [Peptococcaceae bacterium]
MKNKTIKKLVASVLAATMLATFAGCGGASSDSGSAASSAAADSGDVKTVAIVQSMDNPAFDDMREGLTEELKAKGYGEDKVKIEYQNAQGDASNLNTIVQNLVTEGVDVLAPIATPATQACVSAGSDIPVFFTSVSDPVAAGVISDMDKPDKNATGTSNAIPVEDIIDLAQKLTPDVKTFGIIYNTSEDNAVSTVEAAKKVMDEKGLKYEEAVVTNSSEVQQAAQNLVPKVDAVFIPNSAMVQSAMPLIADITREFKKPTYSCSAATVETGAMATVAMSDKAIGAKTADMIIEYLEGKKVTDIPAVVFPSSDVVLNEDLINDIGITFPEGTTDGATFVKETTSDK